MKKVVVVGVALAVLGGTGFACEPPDPCDGWNHSIGGMFNAATPVDIDGPYKINLPIKYHSDEITPPDPATYEGPWDKSREAWNMVAPPWVGKSKWTNDDVADFPTAKVRVVSGIYKAGPKTKNVTFGVPAKDEVGVHKAGVVRFVCQEPECSLEAIQKKAVEYAHEKGIAYMFPTAYGANPTKEGGDWSLRLGGGGGGMVHDGGMSGGGGIGGGKYWVAPGFMPWVVFECWTYEDETAYYNK